MIGTMLATHADVVIGSRYIVGASVGTDWPWHRKALSGFANFYAAGVAPPRHPRRNGGL